jgi:hypothetical protein
MTNEANDAKRARLCKAGAAIRGGLTGYEALITVYLDAAGGGLAGQAALSVGMRLRVLQFDQLHAVLTHRFAWKHYCEKAPPGTVKYDIFSENRLVDL